jgi:hypothetical protein
MENFAKFWSLSVLKPTTSRFDKIVAVDSRLPVSFNGRIVIGGPRNDQLPEELRYLDLLTNYEIKAFDVRYGHVLCHRCYDKVWNRARFGLCAQCYNKEDHKTLQVVDAATNKIYLSRRGSKIKLTGPMIRLPVYQERTIIAYKSIMERPYVDMDRLATVPTDYGVSLGRNRWHPLHCHGAVPMQYLLAELD